MQGRGVKLLWLAEKFKVQYYTIDVLVGCCNNHKGPRRFENCDVRSIKNIPF